MRKITKVFFLMISVLLNSGYAPNREEILRNELQLEKLEKAVNQEPNYNNMIELAKAYTTLSNVSQIMPDAMNIHGKYEKLATTVYKKIEQIEPKDYRFYLDKAQVGVLLNHKVPKESYKAIDRAIELAPDNLEVLDRKEKLLSIDGRWEEIVPIEERVIALMVKNNPKDHWINEKRARLVDMMYCLNQDQKIVNVLQDMYNSGADPDRYYFTIMQFYDIYKTSKDSRITALFDRFKNDKKLSELHDKYGLDKPDREVLRKESIETRERMCRRLMKWVER